MSTEDRIPRIQIRPGYSIPRIIIGAWQLSEGHTDDAIDREQLFSAYDRLVDMGLDTFDCADIYTGVEKMLGEYLRRRRNRHGEAGIENIKIHTKYVPDLDSLSAITKTDVERVVDRSRSRLGLDLLHMVQFAWWDYEVPRYVEVAEWLGECMQRGWINLMGATNFDHRRLAEMIDAGIPLSLHQLQYSVLDQRAHRDMTRFAAEHGLWLATYGTLAGGFLSKKYIDADEPQEPFENRSLRKYKLIIEEYGGWQLFQRTLDVLSSIAIKHHVGIGSVATRFILDRHCVAAAILGTRSVEHLDSILDTFRLHLDDEDRSRIGQTIADSAGPLGDVFELERDRDGPHGRIMKYNLNEN